MVLAPKWQSLGEALSLDEDRLDEIFTNNETDEACLREMLEVYMKRSDLKHSLEEIEEAVKKVKEKTEVSDQLSVQSLDLTIGHTDFQVNTIVFMAFFPVRASIVHVVNTVYMYEGKKMI